MSYTNLRKDMIALELKINKKMYKQNLLMFIAYLSISFIFGLSGYYHPSFGAYYAFGVFLSCSIWTFGMLMMDLTDYKLSKTFLNRLEQYEAKWETHE